MCVCEAWHYSKIHFYRSKRIIVDNDNCFSILPFFIQCTHVQAHARSPCHFSYFDRFITRIFKFNHAQEIHCRIISKAQFLLSGVLELATIHEYVSITAYVSTLNFCNIIVQMLWNDKFDWCKMTTPNGMSDDNNQRWWWWRQQRQHTFLFNSMAITSTFLKEKKWIP